MTAARPTLLGPWRRRFQWLTSALVLLIPFVRIEGISLLRFDLPTLSLRLFGRIYPFEDLDLFLLLVLALLLLFLLVTLVLGRAWCGWACPQTTLSDLAEALARGLGLAPGHGGTAGVLWRRVLWHLCLALIALLVGANLVWYFVSPSTFFARLASGSLHPAALVTLGLIALVVYLDLALIRRLMCREFCPYGRFQTALVDPGTLALRFHPDAAHRCIQCGACVRACPMEIDIRRGYQVECINCGRCLDACREVMARRSQAGIIRYSFGLSGRGPRALFNPRLMLVAGALLLVTGALLVAGGSRDQATLKLARSGTAPNRTLPDGRLAVFFRAVVANHGQAPLTVDLAARLPEGAPLELRGPVNGLGLGVGDRRVVEFALLIAPPRGRQVVEILLRDPAGEILAAGEAYIFPQPGSSP